MMEGARGTIEAIAVKNLQEVLRKRNISAEALFSKYDLNGDGSLSPEEFKAAIAFCAYVEWRRTKSLPELTKMQVDHVYRVLQGLLAIVP